MPRDEICNETLQKPMCVSLAEADQLVVAAETAELLVKIFENFLFHPPVIKALELVKSGAIGEPIAIRIKSNPGRSETAWKVRPHDARTAKNLAAGR